MRTLNAAVMVGALALAAALGTSGIAQAGSGSGRGGGGGGSETVRIQDDCDPTTFNLAIGAGTCVGDGDTLFDEFIADLEEDGESGKWRNNPDDTHIDVGESLKLVNEGGEFHTFTDLTAHGGFGPGCVDLINLIIFGDPTLNDVCDDAGFDPVGVPPGSTNTVAAAALAPGVHFFQCLIHPWMQTTVEVRGHHH